MSYPDSNELITLAELKIINNVTDTTNDTFYSAIIPIVSRTIETYCRRRFLTNTWVQWASSSSEIITDNWPITQVIQLGVPYEAFTIADTSNLLSFNITQTTPNNLNVVSQFSVSNASSWAVSVYPFATYPTVGQLKTAVETANPTVTFTYSNSPSTVTTSTINTLALRATSGKTVYYGCNYFDQTSSSALGDVYRLSDNSDRIMLNPNYYNTGWSFNEDVGEQDIMLAYIAGYTTAQVPSDLKWIVASIIKDMTSIYGLDGGQFASNMPKGIYESESLGDYSYKLATDSAISKLIYGSYDPAFVSGKYYGMLDYYLLKVI